MGKQCLRAADSDSPSPSLLSRREEEEEGGKEWTEGEDVKREGEDEGHDEVNTLLIVPYHLSRLKESLAEEGWRHLGQRLADATTVTGRQLLYCSGPSLRHISELMYALHVLLTRPLLVTADLKLEWDRLKEDTFCRKVFGDETFLHFLMQEAPESIIRQLGFLALDALTATARFALKEDAHLARGFGSTNAVNLLL